MSRISHTSGLQYEVSEFTATRWDTPAKAEKHQRAIREAEARIVEAAKAWAIFYTEYNLFSDQSRDLMTAVQALLALEGKDDG